MENRGTEEIDYDYVAGETRINIDAPSRGKTVDKSHTERISGYDPENADGATESSSSSSDDGSYHHPDGGEDQDLVFPQSAAEASPGIAEKLRQKKQKEKGGVEEKKSIRAGAAALAAANSDSDTSDSDSSEDKKKTYSRKGNKSKKNMGEAQKMLLVKGALNKNTVSIADEIYIKETPPGQELPPDKTYLSLLSDEEYEGNGCYEWDAVKSVWKIDKAKDDFKISLLFETSYRKKIVARKLIVSVLSLFVALFIIDIISPMEATAAFGCSHECDKKMRWQWCDCTDLWHVPSGTNVFFIFGLIGVAGASILHFAVSCDNIDEDCKARLLEKYDCENAFKCCPVCYYKGHLYYLHLHDNDGESSVNEILVDGTVRGAPTNSAANRLKIWMLTPPREKANEILGLPVIDQKGRVNKNALKNDSFKGRDDSDDSDDDGESDHSSDAMMKGGKSGFKLKNKYASGNKPAPRTSDIQLASDSDDDEDDETAGMLLKGKKGKNEKDKKKKKDESTMKSTLGSTMKSTAMGSTMGSTMASTMNSGIIEQSNGKIMVDQFVAQPESASSFYTSQLEMAGGEKKKKKKKKGDEWDDSDDGDKKTKKKKGDEWDESDDGNKKKKKKKGNKKRRKPSFQNDSLRRTNSAGTSPPGSRVRRRSCMSQTFKFFPESLGGSSDSVVSSSSASAASSDSSATEEFASVSIESASDSDTPRSLPASLPDWLSEIGESASKYKLFPGLKGYSSRFKFFPEKKKKDKKEKESSKVKKEKKNDKKKRDDDDVCCLGCANGECSLWCTRMVRCLRKAFGLAERRYTTARYLWWLNIVGSSLVTTAALVMFITGIASSYWSTDLACLAFVEAVDRILVPILILAGGIIVFLFLREHYTQLMYVEEDYIRAMLKLPRAKRPKHAQLQATAGTSSEEEYRKKKQNQYSNSSDDDSSSSDS